MGETKTVIVQLVTPAVWEPIVSQMLQAFRPDEKREQRLALSILSVAHNRHVGITPQLAIGLARLLNPLKKLEEYESPWREIFMHLQKTSADLTGTSNPNSKTLMPYRSFQYTVFELAFPLVQLACYSLNKILLLSNDKNLHSGSLDDSQYRAYSQDLSNMILALINDKGHELGNMVQNFWKERAIALRSMMLESKRLSVDTHPVTLLSYSKLLFDLKPATQYRYDDLIKRLRISHRPRLLDKRQSEAGSTSIKITRSIENLHRILKSELVYPDQLLDDRLYNTGYWSLNPPPKPVQPRDILIVAFFPHILTRSTSGAFAKACWVHFLTQFMTILQQNELTNSEYRWVEGSSQLMETRTLNVLIRDLPFVPAALQAEGGQERDFSTALGHFLEQSGWFPNGWDQRLGTQPSETAITMQSDEESSTFSVIQEWVELAWKTQRESPNWQQQRTRMPLRVQSQSERRENRETVQSEDRSKSNLQLKTEAFAYIHAVCFVPTKQEMQLNILDEELQAQEYTRWQQRLKRVHGLTLVNVPPVVDSIEWSVIHPGIAADFNSSFAKNEGESEQDYPARLSGWLIDHWFEHIAQGMQRG